jgi:hypothetical protein
MLNTRKTYLNNFARILTSVIYAKNVTDVREPDLVFSPRQSSNPSVLLGWTFRLVLTYFCRLGRILHLNGAFGHCKDKRPIRHLYAVRPRV